MTMYRIRQSLICLMILTLAVCLGTVALNAQTSTQGAIAGTVLDPTGAVVPNVSVTIHNMGTNAEIKLTADASGFYKAPLLEPGTYRVTFTATGFATYHAENVIVQVGQVSDVSPRLTVGASSTSIEVTELAPVLNLESPDFSESLNMGALQQIPINNRRWSSLAMTTPGVVSDANGYGLVAVRGISPILNNVEIDGADDNQAFFAEERGRTREAYSTTGAAVREFAVNTGVYSAEYGRAAGGVITSVTRSGTNQLHGQAYFWDRESKWAAMNDYTTLTTAVNGVNVTNHIKPEDLRKIYGFTAGGALIKNKLFWIYTYDQHTHIFPVVGVPYSPANFYTLPVNPLPSGAVCTLTPSTPEKAGNGYLSGDTSATKVEDEEACTLAARQGISYATAAADWASLISGGYLNGGTSVSDLGLNSDIGQVARSGYQEINTPKLDWQINSKEHLSVLYHRLRWDSPGGVQTTAADNYARDTQGTDFVKLDYGVAKLTSLITNNISNELLYQYSRENNNEGQQPYTAYTNADLTAGGNVPEVNVAEGSTGWGFYAGSPYYSYRIAYPLETKWQVGDVLYWNKGNHSMKFGVDAVHNTDTQNNLYEGNGEYVYSYLGQYMNDLLNEKNGTALSKSTSATNYGCDSSDSEYATSATATVVNDYPCYNDFYQGFGTPAYTLATMDTGIFAQDNWKFSPRLTLELGLRWDYEALPASNPAFTTANSTSGSYFYTYPGLTNHPSDKTNFGPRIGFSYDVTGKGNTVVRGGYGMYYGRITNGSLLEVLFDTGSSNAQYSSTFYNAPTSSVSEGPVFPNIFASGAAAKPTSYFFSPNLRNPQVQEYDLMVQRSLGHGTYIQGSYLGALGRELPNFLDVNLNPSTVTSKTFTISDASALGPLGATGSTITIPVVYTGFGNTNLFGSNATNFAAITEMVSNVNSNYNAMVLEALNRSLRAIQFDVNYTWSHALDYSQNALTEGGTNEWYDPLWYVTGTSARINYGNSNYNVPNRVVAYALLNFPNNKTTNWVKYLTNEWSMNNSFQFQNGLPYTLGVSGNKPTGGAGNYLNGSGGSNVIPKIGVNTRRYPRREVDDVRFQKQVPLDKGRNLQLMCNIFNVANHQNITALGTTAYTLSSLSLTYDGQYTTSANNSLGVPTNSNSSGFLYTPREIEFAVRLNF